MEQLTNTPSTAEEEVINITSNRTSGAASTGDASNIEANENNKVTNTRRRNLLYEEYLGFIPNSMKGRQDPRYVYANV